MVPLIALLTFISIAAIILYLLSPRRDPVRERIGALHENEMARTAVLRESAFRRLVWPVFQRLGNLLAALLPHNMARGIERELIAAHEPLPLSMFMVLWFGFAALMGLFVLYLAPQLEAVRLFFVAAFLLSIGFLCPPGVIRRRARARRKIIEHALPDGLDLLVTGMEAGLSGDAAFALVADHHHDALGDTFRDYLRQVGLGRSRREALDELAERSGVEDLIRLAGTVGRSVEVGASMSATLRLQAQDLRARRRVRAQEAAHRAPVWMTIPLALCFLPAMAAVVIVPSILHLLNFVSGGYDTPGG